MEDRTNLSGTWKSWAVRWATLDTALHLLNQQLSEVMQGDTDQTEDLKSLYTKISDTIMQFEDINIHHVYNALCQIESANTKLSSLNLPEDSEEAEVIREVLKHQERSNKYLFRYFTNSGYELITPDENDPYNPLTMTAIVQEGEHEDAVEKTMKSGYRHQGKHGAVVQKADVILKSRSNEQEEII